MSLIRKTANIIGKPYKLGGFGGEKFDCFNVVVNYLRNCGEPIKENEVFEDLSFDTYADAYKKNPQKTMQIAIEYLKTKMMEIPSHRSVAGDILITDFNGHKSLGIDTGNGFMLSATEKMGVIQLPKSKYKIVKVFRWHKQLYQH